MENRGWQVSAKEYRVRIVHDDTGESPRSWGNLGVMLCTHRRYTLGDEQLDSAAFSGWEQVETHLRLERDALVVLPLFLYDHSGISMSVGSFAGRAPHASWDSGQVGFIFATRKGIVENFGNDALGTLERVSDCLRAEVETYDTFLRGDVYGFILESREACESCGHGDWKHEDSCFGFYGLDLDSNGMLDYLPTEHHDAARIAAQSPEYR